MCLLVFAAVILTKSAAAARGVRPVRIIQCVLCILKSLATISIVLPPKLFTNPFQLFRVLARPFGRPETSLFPLSLSFLLCKPWQQLVLGVATR